MSQRRDGAKRLKAYREEHQPSLRAAARALHVSHVTLRDWESGARLPSKPYREAIARWTGNVVPEGCWPLGPRERETLSKAGSVVRSTDKTGTEG